MQTLVNKYIYIYMQIRSHWFIHKCFKYLHKYCIYSKLIVNEGIEAQLENKEKT